MFFIRKYRHHLKRWVSTVSIFATHFQTISIVGNLHLHWPPPVEAVTGLATLSVFENTQIFRPECLVEDRGISTFYLFSILVAGGILFVLLGGLIAVFFLLCIRRVRYGPPGLTINNTGRYSAKCYKEEFEEESRRVSRVSSGARSSLGARAVMSRGDSCRVSFDRRRIEVRGRVSSARPSLIRRLRAAADAPADSPGSRQDP